MWDNLETPCLIELSIAPSVSSPPLKCAIGILNNVAEKQIGINSIRSPKTTIRSGFSFE